MITKKSFFNQIKILITILVLVAIFIPAIAEAASSPAVREAQTILTKFTIPTGPIDGIYGSQTAQGLCTFRQIIGASVNRINVTDSLLIQLRTYNTKYASLNRIPAPSKDGRTSYLLAQKTCQTMLYVKNGFYVKVLRISTGMSGHTTPNGTFKLGSTIRGWSCSTIYPESCATHNNGRFAYISNYGNMYNKRNFYGGYYVHGSTSVPTYPASHGCIRVTVSDADWLYDYVGSIYLYVTGAY